MPYAISDNSPAARHAQAAAGVNTLGNDIGNPVGSDGSPLAWPDGTPVTQQDLSSFQAYWASQNKYRDTLTGEATRQFNVGASQTATSEKNRVAQAKAALKEQKRQYNMTYGLNQQEAALNQAKFAEGQRQFGINTGKSLLDTAATLRGPLNFLEGDAYAQGIQNAGLSPYIQALRSGNPVQFGGATATTGNPTPLTVGTLANTLSGQPATAGLGAAGGGGGGGAPAPASGQSAAPAGQTDAYGRAALSAPNQSYLDAVQGVYQKGLANMPQSYFNNMTPNQLTAFKAAGQYLGRDADSEFEYLKRSQVGQGSSLSA